MANLYDVEEIHLWVIRDFLTLQSDCKLKESMGKSFDYKDLITLISKIGIQLPRDFRSNAWRSITFPALLKINRAMI